VAEGDRVLVMGWERGRVKPTNRNYETHWVMAFALRNGKVAEFREYTDTERERREIARATEEVRDVCREVVGQL
jgi:uncharacterized protein